MLTKVVAIFNSTTCFNSTILLILSLKIFCISLNWGTIDHLMFDHTTYMAMIL
jgi:hypothetical protein